jgi:flagellar basal-body rod protein FlgB
MLRTRMQWHQERQRVLAENVANAETPRYRARDLAPPNFDVVTAVAESETAIQTMVAVRDKVIAAYEEILRMPI